MNRYTWKDIINVTGKISCEEFPISGETDGDEDELFYDISDFIHAVANKYGADPDDVKTYMMDNIDFDPSELEFGAESCGCYINGVPEWLLESEDK